MPVNLDFFKEGIDKRLYSKPRFRYTQPIMKEKWAAIQSELLSYTKAERYFVLAAMACAFCIMGEYAIIRPVSHSVFLTTYGSSGFLYAWLACIPLNLAVVAFYNRLLPKWGCLKMFLCIAAIIVSGNLFCVFFLKKIWVLPFLFYIWKEVYVMVMFQQLWSLIHANMKEGRAKYLYGLMFAIGGAGGSLGSLLPGFCAVSVGSESLLLFTVPLYMLLFLAFFLAMKNQAVVAGVPSKSLPHLRDSLQRIASSKLLVFILLIVVFMQLTSTIVDFQFNTVLETSILDKDLRTQYLGRLFGIVSFVTTGLQVIGSYLFVHYLGLRRSHLFVPMTLCCNAIGFLISPGFGMISVSFAAIKAVDFSLFGVIKEMLYVPLKVEEKFQAKAVIDVFVYRSSKALAASLILGLQFFELQNFLTEGLIALFVIWGFIVIKLFKQEQPSAAPEKQENV